MNIAKYLGTVTCVTALLLAGCARPAETDVTPADIATLDMPTQDQTTTDGTAASAYGEYPADAVSAPVDYTADGEEEVISRMDPDALKDMGVPQDTELAVHSLLAFERLRAAGQTQLGSDMTTAYGPQLVFGRYPNLAEVSCSIHADTAPAVCWMGNTEWPASDTVKNLPYLLNEDVLTYHDGDLLCDEKFCISAETKHPVGQLQPEMARYIQTNCEQFKDGTYRCWDFM